MVRIWAMIKLGNIKLDMPFFQAPLSGYSDWAMREVAREHRAPLTFEGVMLAKSVINPKILRKKEFRPRENEYPVGAQILGTEPDIMAQAAKNLADIGYDILDINFACPAPKVLRRGRGGHLLNNPELVLEIYREVRQAVSCPLTVKIRIGYDESQQSEDNFWQICEGLVNEGIDGIVIHGRTTVQKYFGKSSWDRIRQAKLRFPNTTIVGSGDIFSPEDVVDRLRETNVDGVLIARGAVGNPWIFSDARALIEGTPIPERPNIEEVGRTMLTHFLRITDIYQIYKCVGYFRKFACKYGRLHPQRKKANYDICMAKNKDELLAAILKWYGVKP